MAELEALSVIDPTPDDKRKNPSVEPGVFGRRFPLPLNRPVTLGREAGQAELSVPEDPMISGFHATLLWDGTRLTATERADKPVKNKMIFRGTEQKSFTLGIGESFRIGQTKFTVYNDGEGIPASPPDATIGVVKTPASGVRIRPEEVPFANPPVVLEELAKLSLGLRTRPNEQARIKQMLTVAVNSLPRADAAGLVFIAPGSTPDQPKIGVRDYHVRLSGGGANPAASGAFQKYQFAPSRRLIHRAVDERKGVLHFWDEETNPSDITRPAGSAADATMPPIGLSNETPWAICVPLQHGTRMALYVTGHLKQGETAANLSVAREIAGYQKVIELLAGFLEMTRQTYRLAEEKARFWDFVPKPIRDYLADPDRSSLVMNAREADVAVLFCDLRNFTKFLMQQNRPLEERWRDIAFHLNHMSTAITLNGGVVCRVLGDAVMGFWGWPESTSSEKDRLGAARAAVDILSGIEWMRQHQCGVGVAVGRALVGKLGTQHLAEVDLYGPVVNLAARLEAMTKAFGVSVVVTQEIAEQYDKAHHSRSGTRSRRLGRVRAKGMEDHAFEVCELLPEDALGGQDWTEWNRLVGLFTEGRWSEAYDQLQSFYPDDSAAQCLMREMDRHKRKPPADWDGSFSPRADDDWAKL